MIKRYYHRFIALIIICVLSAACADIAFSGDLEEGLITAYDTYIANNTAITLKAKLEDKGVLNVHPDVKGAILTFFAYGKSLGSATTDENGFAYLEYKPVERKSHYITVKLLNSNKYAAKDDTSLVYWIDPTKPTIISDIDWTISKTDRSTLILRSVDTKSTPMKGAREALAALYEHYNILFVTGREDALLHKTRAWLKSWEFPDLPVFYADIGQTSYFDQGDYKSKAVAKIKKDIPGTTIGIGDKDHDAQAYLENGLIPIIIRTDGDVPEGAVKMTGWDVVREELMKEPRRKAE